MSALQPSKQPAVRQAVSPAFRLPFQPAILRTVASPDCSAFHTTKRTAYMQSNCSAKLAAVRAAIGKAVNPAHNKTQQSAFWSTIWSAQQQAE